MLDRITAGERLDIEITPAPRVICIHCRQPIFYLRVSATDLPADWLSRPDLFTPAAPTGFWPWPDCPCCGRPFHAILGRQPKIKTNKGYLPHG